jgi:catechol 2,3-dioxygenase-like lactoylglutathione lyase family enzyme
VTIGNASTVCVDWEENLMTKASEAKFMARQLRAALSSDGIVIPHSKSLELIAKTLGYADWNTANAKLDQRRTSNDEVRFLRCSPILRIFDEKKAREFYCDFLGFEVAFEHRFAEAMPLYLGLERPDLSLHLSEHHGDASPGANVFVVTTNIRAFHRELAEKQYAFNRPGLDDLPWGLQMQVNDPFGNRIRFCQQDA